MVKMALSFKSRFAVLKIEDDEDEVEEKKCAVRDKQNSNQNTVKKKLKKKKIPEEKGNVGANVKTETTLQKFGLETTNKPKKKATTCKPPSTNKKQVSSEQWEEWKKRDSDFVADSFENDLKQAILLSKLEYEEKKEVCENLKQNSASAGKNNKKQTKKKEKATPITLGQFNNLDPREIENLSRDNLNEVQCPSKSLPTTNEPDFWDKIETDTENVLCQEEKAALKKKCEPNLARALQFQDEIEKRDKEILSLSLEVETLKTELLTVKTRNKKLCNILGQGEMREKAEILLHVDQLTKVKDELTQEVSDLHVALEQERSKVHNLQMELKKYQTGKRS